jgi:prepilin-type N-terminal cleavage/methylation domain-containing protein
MHDIIIKTKCPNGFALTELVVVIAIIGILLGIAVPNFNQWQRKSKVEAQVKEMSTDFNELRIRAITRKQRHSITLNANSYVFRSYSSDEEPISAGTVLPPGNITVSNSLQRVNGGASTFFSGQRFEIDHMGLLSSQLSPEWGTGDFIRIQNQASPSIDCIKLETTRINIGKTNPAWSNCDDK